MKYKASSLSLFIKRWFLLELSRIEAEYKANDEPIFPLKKMCLISEFRVSSNSITVSDLIKLFKIK